jgi:hypothetical protein
MQVGPAYEIYSYSISVLRRHWAHRPGCSPLDPALNTNERSFPNNYFVRIWMELTVA